MTAQKLGPGTLKFGETASEQEFATLLSKASVSPELSDEDEIPFLDGSSLKPEGDYSGTVEGTIHQDYSIESLVAWTWKHSGETLPFVFTPVAAGGLKVTGKCQIKPVTIGGDVKKFNTSDFSFPLVGGLPTLTAVAPSGS